LKREVRGGIGREDSLWRLDHDVCRRVEQGGLRRALHGVADRGIARRGEDLTVRTELLEHATLDLREERVGGCV
jgi:hypothetical protein